MKRKKALITGISGQDGSYLAKLLLSKNYIVYGGDRRTASGSMWRLNQLAIENRVKIIDFELAEEGNITNIIRKFKFDEIYNLAAQSFVGSSYNTPLMTSDINGIAVTRILEGIRNYSPKTKFYQASTSEMYGNTISKIQNENGMFHPTSPYAISKLYAHWMINMYREAYGLHCCSGILFNHESPLRGNEFVTKRIVTELTRIKFKKQTCLSLGNIYSKRDWGFSGDYVLAMWKMLQQKEPNDFVIASGRTHSIKEFVNLSAKYLGFDIVWRGKGLEECAIDKNSGRKIVKIDKKFFRPTEVNYLKGDYSKARRILKWAPKTSFKDLIKMMCENEIKKYKTLENL